MKKIINIEGVDRAFVSNGATMLHFKKEFGKSFLDSFMNCVDFNFETGEVDKSSIDFNFVDTINEFAYVCAKSADPSIDSFIDWLSQFDNSFSLLEHADEFLELIGMSAQTTVEPKDHKKK